MMAQLISRLLGSKDTNPDTIYAFRNALGLYNGFVSVHEESSQYIDFQANLFSVLKSNEALNEKKLPPYPMPVTKGETQIIPIKGVLFPDATPVEKKYGAASVKELSNWVGEAEADSNVKEIIYHVESPGGLVGLIGQTANQILNVSKVKPSVSFTSELKASAAYWLTAGLKGYIAPGATVGSIGVYSVWADVSKMLQDQGVDIKLIRTSKFKGEGADGKYSEEFLAEMMKRATKIDQEFKGFVEQHKSLTDKEEAFNGLAWQDEDVIQLGLDEYMVNGIDDIMTE